MTVDTFLLTERRISPSFLECIFVVMNFNPPSRPSTLAFSRSVAEEEKRNANSDVELLRLQWSRAEEDRRRALADAEAALSCAELANADVASLRHEVCASLPVPCGCGVPCGCACMGRLMSCL